MAKNKSHFLKALGVSEGFLDLGAIIAFFVLGGTQNLWYCAWTLIFVPDVICSIFRAMYKHRFCEFNIVFAALFAFFFVCLWYPGRDANLWHPMWVVFLGIPAYFIVFGPIDGAIKDHEKKSE